MCGCGSLGMHSKTCVTRDTPTPCCLDVCRCKRNIATRLKLANRSAQILGRMTKRRWWSVVPGIYYPLPEVKGVR